jgi:putative ABC transport system substrate-binding protein
MRAIGWALIALIFSISALAQSARTPRVGVLHAGSSKESPAIQREPFERGLRELGWAPGSTVLIEYRYAEGNAAKLPELALDLVRARVDVIVARAPAAISAARQATTTIPIVMSAGTDDPVARGWVKSMSQPGGNVTGLLTLVTELDNKRLELLKETFPRIRRVAVLSNPSLDGDAYARNLATLRANATRLNVTLEIFEIRRLQDLHEAIAAIGRGQFEGLLVRGDPQVIDHHRSAITAMATANRLPAVYPWRFFAEAGGLISYGTNFPGFHHRSATYVSRILRGAKPGALPIEQPSNFELVVNVGAAKALGLLLPPTLLFRADELIQ